MTDPADPLPLPTPEPPDAPPPIRCRLCGRPLTDPVARRWGLGDGCRAKIAERAGPRLAGFVVEQEGLFSTGL